MQLLEKSVNLLRPGCFPGITFPSWIQLLAKNRFRVTSDCFFRCAAITTVSVINSFVDAYERSWLRGKLETIKVAPPLFVIGHWRSGTTLLHSLLARDPRFAYPNVYQVGYPRGFLSTESRLITKALELVLPATRPSDNVRFGFHEPSEDEYALCSMTTLSPYTAFAFPQRREFYERYLTLQDVDERELQLWKDALVLFLKKLTWKYRRPLILKSPPHTARIKLLLGLFPEAKFVHIHRDPYRVFQSTRHWATLAFCRYRLQPVDEEDINDWIFERYRVLYETFLRQRDLIPPHNLCELSFEDLEHDLFGELERVYESLELPSFSGVAAQIREHCVALRQYPKRNFTALSPHLRDRISREWAHIFRRWG
jgi:hypothetical protein